MNLLINSINNENVLNSYNFARKCDIVYSEVVSKINLNFLIEAM